jgi:serine/threonine protein kinase
MWGLMIVAAAGERAGAAVLIGIGEYLRAEQVAPLRFAARDAQAMERVLIDPEISSFPAQRVKLLTDRLACRDTVAHHLSKWLPEQARGAEIALIYFAGHGMIHRIGHRDEGYLLPYDADPADLVTRGLLMADLARWIEAIDAGAVVICLDCCHAAKVIPRGATSAETIGRDMTIRPALFQELTGRGRYLIASCDDGQVSVEAETWGHGLFTYHLLEGIRGAGDRDGDGRIGVAELFEHVAEAVERDARALGMTQKPWCCSIGAGGVYLSAPHGTCAQRRQKSARSSIIVAAERVWREEGAAAAVGEIERTMDRDDVGQLVSVLDLLKVMEHPAAVPLLFRCLAHTCVDVRTRAKNVVRAIGWEKVAAFIEVLALHGGGEDFGAVLDGLAAFEAHRDIVSLLDRLVPLLKGDPRNRIILLLERKQQALDLERIAALFEESKSPYRIQKALGHGVHTAAYLARDESNEVDVVVRVLRPELANLPQVRAQFMDLSRRSLKLVHQNLALTRDVRAYPDRHIYCAVRDYVDGVTLQKLLEAGRVFAPDQIIKILRQLLQALTPLHGNGMVHGSIKPSNVFLCGEDRVILGDLALPLRGISLQLDRLSYDYRYAPPETFRQGAALGPWSDFYAVGCVAYELACGRPPFVSDNHFELAGMHDREFAELPTRRGSRLGPAGDPLLLRLLAKSPSGRFASLEAALEALDYLKSALQPKAKLQAPPAPIVGDATVFRYAPDAVDSVASFWLPDNPAPSQETPAPALASPEPASDDNTLDIRIELHQNRSGDDVGAELPQVIGKYTIIGRIGLGGFSNVYLARDPALDRVVAIKVNITGSGAGPGAQDRFLVEARAVAQLRHPNIITIHDVGEAAGTAYTVLEYVEGGSLSQQMGSARWTPNQAASLMATLARAVAHAHSCGVVHRDLKPSNILFTNEGTPKISDFGLAKLIDQQQEDTAATQHRAIIGTPAYMAPEQARGDIQRIGPATDVHALGVIFYELLAGRRPFGGGTPAEMLAQVMKYSPQPPSRWRQDLPHELDAICLKCLSKDPAHRYDTSAALADDLERFLRREPISARPLGIWERLRRHFSLTKSPSDQDRPGQ